MFRKHVWCILLGLALAGKGLAQKPVQQPVDTLFTDYDALFSEMDIFLDSLLAPRSFVLLNLNMSTGFLNYEAKNSYAIESKRSLFYSPSLSYFSKTGLGATVGANVVNDGNQMNPYQITGTLSYDFLKNRKFITGLSYTHFFTKSDLPFYTSPLQNSAYAYFTYRKWFIKPTVAASYAWGSRSAYYDRAEYITSIRLRPNGYTRVNTTETLNDFSLNLSVRHDFYWLNVFSKSDHFRLTPQITYISGSQKFGFNQNSNTYGTIRGTNTNVLYNTENIYLDDQLYFQPLSLTGFLKTEYSIGKFYIQPQVQFDYYFPATSNNFTTTFVVSAGVIF